MRIEHLALVGLASGAVLALTLRNADAPAEHASTEERQHSYYRAKQTLTSPAAARTQTASLPAPAGSIAPTAQSEKPAVAAKSKPKQSANPKSMIDRQLRPPEVQSMTTFMRKIKRAIGTKSAPEDLFRELEGLKLRPRKSTATSEATGDLITVRAQQAMPGVRYFHAQFMSDGAGAQPVAQHISFEIRPSADGMYVARKMAEEMFQLNIPPTIDNENYVEWNRNGRTLWIKKFTDIRDLKSDLFNARDKNDLGLVMVALELDPHAHEKPE